MLYPLTFHPIFKERIWGGRNLAALYGKALPAGQFVGESWEISDRPEDISVVSRGPLTGKNLRWLMENNAEELLGSAASLNGRFPLLIKILDAQDKLSLQVHPPARIAAELGGEPKTEMWYIAEATHKAALYAGLKKGTTRQSFQECLEEGKVEGCFHYIPVRKGDAMFLPSGRVHAIGAGNVIFEIQQNSDTTYRVFDWYRKDSSGKSRDLHIEQSLKSIDFSDFEPSLIRKSNESSSAVRPLVTDTLFKVEEWQLQSNTKRDLTGGVAQVIGVLYGKVLIESRSDELLLLPGQFCLLPGVLDRVKVKTEIPSGFLRAIPG